MHMDQKYILNIYINIIYTHQIYDARMA